MSENICHVCGVVEQAKIARAALAAGKREGG